MVYKDACTRSFGTVHICVSPGTKSLKLPSQDLLPQIRVLLRTSHRDEPAAVSSCLICLRSSKQDENSCPAAGAARAARPGTQAPGRRCAVLAARPAEGGREGGCADPRGR